jgi:hypothetical protein
MTVQTHSISCRSKDKLVRSSITRYKLKLFTQCKQTKTSPKHDKPLKIVRKLLSYLRFVVLTAVVMKSYILWDIMPCSPLKMLPPPSGLHGIISQKIGPFINKLPFLGNFILKLHLHAGRKLKTLQLLHGSYISIKKLYM